MELNTSIKNCIKPVHKYIKQNFPIQKIFFSLKRFLVNRSFFVWYYEGFSSDYWASRDMNSNHSPDMYTKLDKTTYATLDDLMEVLDKDASFLEIGCNAGRNLNYLYSNGYHKLAGIDINRIAIEDCLKNKFPELFKKASFYVGDASHEIRRFEDNSFDVVFSVFVLIHIHPSKRSLFRDMVRVSSKYIVILTDTNPFSSCPYDFETIFTTLGCTLVQKKVFYGESMPECKLPLELYNKREHFFCSRSLLVFVKSDKL